MSDLDADMLGLTLVMLALMAFMIVTPFLYIYYRRKMVASRPPKPPAPNPPSVPQITTTTRPTRKQATPEQLLLSAYRATFAAGILTLIPGMIPFVLSRMPAYATTITMWPADWKNFVVGFLLLALGFFIKRRSLPALIASMIIFALNGLFDVFNSISNSRNTNALICTTFWILLMLIMMYGGVGAIKALKQAELHPSENL